MSARWALADWYRRNARDLPWRRTRDPYRIWLSEVMLQQTQVATVEPYYERFLTAFPTIADLAAAPLDQVLGLWQGLGYYGRARNLHRAAQAVVAQHDGRLPAGLAELRALPGIGDYTAAAVGSLVFGLPEPALDTNAIRVVARLFAIAGDPSRGETRREIRRRSLELLDEADPAHSNQAMIELGATVCTPRAPACGLCPVAEWCAARLADRVESYPASSDRRPPRERLHACAVIERNSRRLFVRRPPRGRWGGLWELPRVELEPGDDAAGPLAAHLAEALGLAAEMGECLAAVPYAISGERIDLRAYAFSATGEPRPMGYDAVSWSADGSGLPLSSMMRRLLGEAARRRNELR